MSSRIALSAFTTRLVVARPGSAPPMRKNTSERSVGSFASWVPPAFLPPICTRTDEFTGPASTMRPDTLIPGTLEVSSAALPFVGISVANPSPSTTVFGLTTLIGCGSWYTPGVRIRFWPSASAALIEAIDVAGLATKKWLPGIELPATEPPE